MRGCLCFLGVFVFFVCGCGCACVFVWVGVSHTIKKLVFKISEMDVMNAVREDIYV